MRKNLSAFAPLKVNSPSTDKEIRQLAGPSSLATLTPQDNFYLPALSINENGTWTRDNVEWTMIFPVPRPLNPEPFFISPLSLLLCKIMRINGKRYLPAAVFILPLLLLMVYTCTGPEVIDVAEPEAVYLNHHDTVKYTGIEPCRECHYQNYVTYMRTGMGLSFDTATQSKSAAVIGPDSLLHDHYKDLYYKPYRDDGVLKLHEFRLLASDTIHSRIQRVDYVVGSGQHTNSHIYVINGYAHQVPFTYYTQDGKFDFPPGFEGGYNSRFSRKIGLECMSCHNSFPEMVLGSENKYTHIPDGINCERCHGPGEVHVKLKREGQIVDTSQFIDYSIVNPADLSLELQMDICVRCHLQGTMVLKPGKSFYDYRPGMVLSEVMDIFMPRLKGGKEDFIMASHVERLKESRCYIASGDQLNCLYCHTPHISHMEVEQTEFISHCISCHKTENTRCTATEAQRNEKENDCIVCHMPESGSRDIPHVRVHDHRIAIPPTPEQLASERKFHGLISVNNPGTDPLSKAKGYLLEHEAYHSSMMYLDSAYYYLQEAAWLEEPDNFNAIVNYYFLKEDYDELVALAEDTGPDHLLNKILVNLEYSNYDAWTAYRIGQAYEWSGDIEAAYNFYTKAVSLARFNLEFQNKMGSVQVMLQELDRAERTFEFILNENPLFTSA
ncbi:MAG: multiheme c-type cytochrome, partial [Bacteroidota bacterium]